MNVINLQLNKFLAVVIVSNVRIIW